MTDSGVVVGAAVPQAREGEPCVLPSDLLSELEGLNGLLSADDTDATLRRLCQYAVRLEFATIPPYLTAMYSIRDKRSPAYQLIRSVVMEEMVHLALAANLLKAAGGEPELVPPPSYPVRLFAQDPGGGRGPLLQLMPASPRLFRDTFMRIEQPAEPYAPAQDKAFSTIGQLYKKIGELFRRHTWPPTPGSPQIGDEWNFGNNGGTVIKVTDLTSAEQAINEVIEQGEGADVVPDETRQKFLTSQKWGQYQYYGPRADGTYGPVLGTPYEMSHYAKFRMIADGTTPLPETYPMIAEPSADKYENPLACRLSDLFDRCYGHLVDRLQGALRNPGGDDFFEEVTPLMRVALPVLATQLMQVPVADRAPASTVDPTAGPAFRYPGIVVPTPVEVEITALIDEVRAGSLKGGAPTLEAALRKVRDNIPPGMKADA
ncbi:ferritin-like domain-containing protein [Actinosynnema sp. CA-248983]